MCPNPKQKRCVFNFIGTRMRNTLQGLGLETGLLEQRVRDVGKQLGDKLSSFNVPPGVHSFWESCKKYAAENPLMATTILALVISCAVPVTGFLSFALITLLGTFISFLFVEGTLLGIATAFLGSILLIVCIFTLSVAFCGFVTYLTISKLYKFATGFTAPQRLLAKLPLIGYVFGNIQNSGTNGDAVKDSNDFDEDEDDAASDEGIDSID